MQERDDSWKKDFTLWPSGVCHRVVPSHKQFEPKKWGALTGHLAENWSYPADGFPVTSWEKVANDEMWHAKISTAFFMFRQGTEIKADNLKILLFVNSYKLYKSALQKHKRVKYPSFWHKNFALVAEKLIHFELPDLRQNDLCEESITHFELYLQLDKEDEDRPGIESAVKTLRARLQFIQQMEQVDITTDDVLKRAENRNV